MRILVKLVITAIAAALIGGVVVVGVWELILIKVSKGDVFAISLLAITALAGVLILWGLVRLWRQSGAFLVAREFVLARPSTNPIQSVNRQAEFDDKAFKAWLAANKLDHSNLPPSEMAKLRRQFRE